MFMCGTLYAFHHRLGKIRRRCSCCYLQPRPNERITMFVCDCDRLALSAYAMYIFGWMVACWRSKLNMLHCGSMCMCIMATCHFQLIRCERLTGAQSPLKQSRPTNAIIPFIIAFTNAHMHTHRPKKHRRLSNMRIQLLLLFTIAGMYYREPQWIAHGCFPHAYTKNRWECRRCSDRWARFLNDERNSKERINDIPYEILFLLWFRTIII